MKKIMGTILVVFLIVLFVFLPFPAADLYLRITFDMFSGRECLLYYSTDPSGVISGDSYLTSEIDENNQIEFHLGSDLKGKITNLRIDFPDEEQLICVKNITLSSAGIIQKEINPCVFFDEKNLSYQNGIQSIDLAWAKNRAYLSTGADDPYVLLSQGMVDQIQRGYSNFRLTRLAMSIFVVLCYLSWKKGPFSKDTQEEL